MTRELIGPCFGEGEFAIYKGDCISAANISVYGIPIDRSGMNKLLNRKTITSELSVKISELEVWEVKFIE